RATSPETIRLETALKPAARTDASAYSLYQLLRPGAIAAPYALYAKIRELEPVHWDPFLNSWVITSYAECVLALQRFKAFRTPSQERLDAMELGSLKPYAQVMLQQLLFIDPPSHTRIRSLCSAAFTPGRMELMRTRLTAMAHKLVDAVAARGSMDLVAEFARPFPGLVLATLIGLPEKDVDQLLHWVGDVSELLGNFEHDPDRIEGLVCSVEELKAYLTAVLHEQRKEQEQGNAGEGVMPAMIAAEVDGEPKLTDDEIVANVMLMVGGGLEEPANLICAGMLSMLERPGTLELLASKPELMTSGIEELLRFNSPTQHTGRVAPEDVMLGGKQIKQGQAVTIVMAAANRDPQRFADPDSLELAREDNRHLAFGWAAHYCLGAPLARLAGQIAFTVLTERLEDIQLGQGKPRWREMAAMRGLTYLPLTFRTKSRETKF
ncbi:MAG: cytochrome P450, partial [Bryocella sp.]